MRKGAGGTLDPCFRIYVRDVSWSGTELKQEVA